MAAHCAINEVGPLNASLPWQIYAVFESIKPDYHIDLHTFSTLSIPFIFLDRSVRDSPCAWFFSFVCALCGSCGAGVIPSLTLPQSAVRW